MALKSTWSWVQTKFFPPEFRLRRVGVTDPRRTDENAVTCEEVVVRLAGEPLLHREYVIREAAITGVQANADRITDGGLESATDEGNGFDLGPLQRHIKQLGLHWYDQLESAARKQLDPQSLETVQTAEAVESEWTLRFDDLESRIDTLQQRIDAVRELADTDGDAIRKLDAYTRATTEVQSILRESQQIRIDVGNLPSIARHDVARMDEARRRDVARLQQRLQSLPLNSEQITESLIGPELADRLSRINQWIGWMRRYFSTDAIEPAPPSQRGEWIEFPRAESHPTFVLESLTLSGEATRDGQAFAIQGACQHVSSDPGLYGLPTEWTFEMAGPHPLAIVGRSDLTTATPRHEVAFNWKSSHPIRQMIGDEANLAVYLSADSVRCDGWVRLDGDQLQGRVHLAQAPLSVALGETADEFAQRWVAPALSTVTSADTTLHLSGALNQPDWHLESDLGPQIARGFNQLVFQEIDVQRTRLLAQADDVARQQIGMLSTVVNGRARELLAELTSGEDRAKQAIARLADDKLDLRKVSDKLNLDRFLRR